LKLLISHKSRRQHGVKHHGSLAGGENCRDEPFTRHRFHQVPRGTEAEGGPYECRVIVRGEDHHSNSWMRGGELMNEVEAVLIWKANVDKHDIGVEIIGARQGGMPIGRLTYDNNVIRRFEDFARTNTHILVVID
jgi:hypothetical protein